MGVFSVPVKVRNWQNRYLPPDRQGKEIECAALVDSGAAEFALPVELLEPLRLEYLGEVRVYTADAGSTTIAYLALRKWRYRVEFVRSA